MSKIGFAKIACIMAAFWVATALVSPAQTFTTILKFDGTNGDGPYGSLVQGTDGNFYGITQAGGVSHGCFIFGCGTLFEVTPTGTATVLHNFCGQGGCDDGYEANGGMVQGANGSFYGTTEHGGTGYDEYCVAGGPGCGIVFEITPARKLIPLYNFCTQQNCTDGILPNSGLVLGPNGNFYGTTYAGGANCFLHSGGGCGTIFEVTPAGKLTTLYSFCSQINSKGQCSDGMSPSALVLGSNGNFYGTTELGGEGGGEMAGCSYQSTGSGCGTVFEMTPAGKLTTLYSFCLKTPCGDGQFPNGLVQAANGKLYGTTNPGLTDYGAVFEISAPGKLTTLYRFCVQGGTCPDGQYPNSGLIQGTDGNFYGTTQGATYDCALGSCGTVFSITPKGALTTLHNFGSSEGSFPYSGLVQGTDGQFYGSAYDGGNYCNNDGSNSCGTIFSVSVGLGPFIAANPNFGAVGKAIAILGNGLTGTTAVTFNGTPAAFEVVSDTYIKTRVPTGATAGQIEVTTPSGTLSTYVVFHVLP
jgi:uncharacterized repeat protein (TIGR03803 family)